MKKIITLLSLLLTSFINAQNYIPMAIENAQWVIYHSDDDGYPPFTDYYYNYRIEGEITINDVVYKKVFRRAMDPVNPDTNQPVSLPLNIGEDHLYGAIRDDISNRKVYGLVFCNETFPPDANYCDCDVEVLMFDFNMNIDEYYPDDCMFIGGSNFYLGEIVYQEIVNETRQVQRIYSSVGDTIDLRKFEGLGSNAGLFEVTCYFECNYNTYISHYCVGTDEECLSNYTLAVKQEIINNTFKIYPNPVINKLSIENQNKQHPLNIKIYTIYGKLLYTKTYNNTYNEIDMTNFTSGIYLLKINKSNIYKIIK